MFPAKYLTPLALILVLAVSAPKELVKFSLSSYIRPDKSLSMELDVSVPKAPGSYPTILFVTGLSGIAPAFMQSQLVDSVAEQGYAWMTVLISLPRSPG